MPVNNTDIEFRYTTPSYLGSAMSDPSLSSGGFPSQTNAVFSALFNERLGRNLGQYRCIAVTNTNQTSTAYGVRFYLRQASLNPNTSVQIGVELPITDAQMGVVATGDLISFTDSTLSGFADNTFVNCAVTFTSGSNIGLVRQVISYDAATKTVTFNMSLPSALVSGVGYTIKAAPSGVAVSSTVPPVLSSAFAGFSLPTTVGSALGIDFNSRSHGADMHPNDTVYVWFKRLLSVNSPAFQNNEIVLATRYNIV